MKKTDHLKEINLIKVGLTAIVGIAIIVTGIMVLPKLLKSGNQEETDQPVSTVPEMTSEELFHEFLDSKGYKPFFNEENIAPEMDGEKYTDSDSFDKELKYSLTDLEEDGNGELVISLQYTPGIFETHVFVVMDGIVQEAAGVESKFQEFRCIPSEHAFVVLDTTAGPGNRVTDMMVVDENRIHSAQLLYEENSGSYSYEIDGNKTDITQEDYQKKIDSIEELGWILIEVIHAPVVFHESELPDMTGYMNMEIDEACKKLNQEMADSEFEVTVDPSGWGSFIYSGDQMLLLAAEGGKTITMISIGLDETFEPHVSVYGIDSGKTSNAVRAILEKRKKREEIESSGTYNAFYHYLLEDEIWVTFYSEDTSASVGEILLSQYNPGLIHSSPLYSFEALKNQLAGAQ